MEIEDEFHGGPPDIGTGVLAFGEALLEGSHEGVPFVASGVEGEVLKVAGRVEAVDGFEVHEEVVAEEEDSHLGDADGAESGEDFGPDVAVVGLVCGDEVGVVFKVEGLSEGGHGEG